MIPLVNLSLFIVTNSLLKNLTLYQRRADKPLMWPVPLFFGQKFWKFAKCVLGFENIKQFRIKWENMKLHKCWTLSDEIPAVASRALVLAVGWKGLNIFGWIFYLLDQPSQVTYCLLVGAMSALMSSTCSPVKSWNSVFRWCRKCFCVRLG